MHTPVLLSQVLDWLDARPGRHFIDATFGKGGFTYGILEGTSPDGFVIAIERDPILASPDAWQSRFPAAITPHRMCVVCSSFSDLRKVVAGVNRICLGAPRVAAFDGVVFDLGLCSWHLEESGRGFSFQRDEPLDMRFDPSDRNLTSAVEILATASVEALETILREFGEERFARRIASVIVEIRRNHPIKRTTDLVACVTNALPKNILMSSRRHPATKTFQALRIAVNRELEELEQALPQAISVLKPAGRLAVISYHSLEDRIVKRFMRRAQRAGLLDILTPKPVRPSLTEISRNPRARSAKLRVGEKSL